MFAWTFYREPNFLLLDEAASALDTEREQAVNQVVKSLGITKLLTAHRESMLAMVGKRAEQGRG